VSTGHFKTSGPGLGENELNRILNDPRVVAWLARPRAINRFYDLPYLGGYSKDGRMIYFDRHFPAAGIKIGSRLVNVTPFLMEHESVEKALIDLYGYKYQAAHEVATQAEHRKVRAAGILPKDYEAAIKPHLTANETENLRKVPPDLDLTPYTDTHDVATLARIRRVMNTNDWRRAVAGKKLNGQSDQAA
jgi:hypothetical protein